ncbi:lasso peptide biosynthesis B2 protein [Streptomyces sp. NPDC044780]|uniref:Lasso peptide biosynthesis B2 protein n=1 Tax=Streptomyces luomodiensis TaxID=3026192 RepID=A0ABY9V5F5_9ACTN|nr:lasso peptide biosynthesis B2 protein [Streptomyces sp. SCA4-21]WNF00113.1 lasso peptide biosynthesis B2 protein [Streptomyces sp. SCA4-21]
MTARALSLEPSTAPPWRVRPVALCVVGVARLLAKLPPRRLRQVMETVRRGARPANEAETLRARNAVVAMSVPCAGPRCLQRSIATALLCRTRGAWPDWVTGVRTQPFRAHAWVEADGKPVGESTDEVRHFHILIRVPGRR